MARATASRGASSSTKRSPSRVVQRRALAADRLGDQEALAARAGRRRRWGGTGRTRGRRASAPAARASSRPEPNEPGGLVVRDHSAAAPPVARIVAAGDQRAAVLEPDAAARPSRRPARAARAPSRTSIAGVLGDVGGELAQDPPAGRAAAGVDDAADAVAALEPEREVAVAVGVEADAERLEVAEARGRLVASAPRRPSGARARGRRRACPRDAAPASRRPPARRRAPPCAQ